MKTLMDAVRGALETSGAARVLCAVSGGCDSMALLHALYRLRNERPLELMASHVQHGLRGQDSLEDERFVRRMCQQLGVPLLVEKAELSGTMDDPGMETRARDCRRAIFVRQMQTHHMDALLTAHHRDDQTETVLLHLLRGAGMEGLCGMQPVVAFGCGVLLRPFLALPRKTIADAMRAEGLDWREDQSNQQAVTPRNALRLQILPELEQLFSQCGAHIAQTAQALQADEAYLRQQADELYREAAYTMPPLFLLDRQKLMQAPRALSVRALRRWWREGLAAGGFSPEERTLSHQDTEQLYRLMHQSSGSINLPCGLMAAAGQHHLHLLRQSGEPLADAQPCEVLLKPGEQVYRLMHATVTQRPSDGAAPNANDTAVLTPDILARRPVLRAPRPGDRIQPLGAPGSKPLRRFLTDRHIDPALRPALTVLACGSDVLWIPQICTAEALRITHAPDGCVRLDGAMTFWPHRS
ncbi:MAG: tRNA lysidine(34) synthetase TilS [Clostridia bacterium]|nr:tRNA lysidine(34) synthetase TilS [Clostridia bacterium]